MDFIVKAFMAVLNYGLPILLVGTGIFLTFRLKFLQFTKLGFALKSAFMKHEGKSEKHTHGDISHFESLMTALSATIGTGNIVGVATAIGMGGPGALFWMWLSALFGMATKYTEGILAVKYRVVNEKNEMSGGPMYYIERGTGKRWLAILFAFFATVASFGIGSSTQSNSIAEAVHASTGMPLWATGTIITVLTAVVVLGGIKSIARTAAFVVPFMAILYVLGGLVIIFMNLGLVIPAFEMIFKSAFGVDAAWGGALGAMIKLGIDRGLFSNEAGLGSAPIAAAAAKTDHPARQAFISMTGTFIDTIIVCTITGLAIVMAYCAADPAYVAGINDHTLKGAKVTINAFNILIGPHAGHIVTVSLVFFAFSTILGWCYYGEKCATYLMGERALLGYRLVFIATVMIGAVMQLNTVWKLADIFNSLMAFPNLVGLLLLSGVAAKETKDFYERRKKGELY